jgi:two-component system, NarL family, invasion response regulator UvrY
MDKVSIVIVDDHHLIRQMWALLFSGNPDFEVVGDSGNLDEALELIKIKRPAIVFLDINLGQDTGMDAIPVIRQFSPNSKVIVISMHTQSAYAKKMIQLGAKGYVTKNSSQEEIIIAVKEVMAGGIYICNEIKSILAGESLFIDDDKPNIAKLSLREIEIIKLIKKGLSSKEIAILLFIGLRTVEVHRYNMLKKLKLNNTASLINFINNTDLNFI